MFFNFKSLFLTIILKIKNLFSFIICLIKLYYNITRYLIIILHFNFLQALLVLSALLFYQYLLFSM